MYKRNYKKKAVPSKKAKAKALVSTVPLNEVQKKQVKRLTREFREIKFHTNQLYATAVGADFNTGGTHQVHLNDLTDTSQNALDTGRVGDEIEITKLHVVLRIDTGSMATLSVGLVRCIIFQYKPNFPLAATLSSDIGILLNYAPGGNVYTAMSNYNHDTRSDYTILYDKTYQTAESTSNPHNGIYRNFYVNLKNANKRIQYDGGGITGPKHIYIMLITDNWTEAAVTATYNARLYYRDS